MSPVLPNPGLPAFTSVRLGEFAEQKKFRKSWLFRLPSPSVKPSLRNVFIKRSNWSKNFCLVDKLVENILASRCTLNKLKNDRLEIPLHPWGLSVSLLITHFLSFIAIVESRELFHRRVAHPFLAIFFFSLFRWNTSSLPVVLERHY